MVQNFNLPDLKYEKNNIFHFDNESFRFLAANKQGIEFEDNLINDFSQSWEKSINSINNLLSYLNLIPSHNIKNTTSLNEIGRLLFSLADPISEVTQNSEVNNEKNQIIAICSKLSFFLKENSITGYFDTTILYLELLIENDSLKGFFNLLLEKDLEMLVKQNKIIQLHTGCSELITIDQIPILVEKLKKLPLYGPILKRRIERNEGARLKQSYNPIVIQK